jgi:hypothetical protein
LTELEYASVEAAALRAGLGLSEWCRRVVLESADREASAQSESILLAELLSLRAVLINVMFRLSRGAPISEDEMRQLIDRADRDKHKRASAALGAGKDERR